jgi:predicted RNase H-like HicB family nuclease
VSRVRIARVIYRAEPDGWWAESPDFPGYTAVGRNYDEVRELAREGLPDFAGEELSFQETVFSLVSYGPSTISHGLGFRYTTQFVSPDLAERVEPPATGVLTPQEA